MFLFFFFFFLVFFVFFNILDQQFITPEWDEHNAESYLDIETATEWWSWMDNVVVPNLYSTDLTTFQAKGSNKTTSWK